MLATSAATGEGLDELANAIFRHVRRRSAARSARETPATHRVYRPGRGDAYSVERTGPGAFRVEGERVERLIARHDVDNDEALRYVEERLRALGVIKALESAGFEPGDDVEIARDRLRARSRLIQVPDVRPLAALICLLAAVAGCGGGDDKADAEQTVRDFVDGHARARRRHVLRRAGDPGVSRADHRRDGRQGEASRASASSRAMTGLRMQARAGSQSTKVDGDKATVTAVLRAPGPAQARRCSALKKEDGDWKLAGAGE